MGLNIKTKNDIGVYTKREILSGYVAAIDLGITSDITMITTVVTAVAIPTFKPISTSLIL